MAARQLQRLRLAKELARAQAEAQAEDGAEEEEEEEEEEAAPLRSAPRNAFAALLGDNEDEEEEEEEEPAAPPPTPPPQEAEAETGSASQARRKKRGGKKGRAGAPEEADDEIDSALRELGLSPAQRSDAPHGGDSALTPRAPPLLGVDVRHLRAEEEMRRIFGGAVLQAAAAAGAAPAAAAGRRRGAPTRHLRSRGGVLARAKESWPAHTGGTGLSMELCCDSPPGEPRFRFVHSSAWQGAQADFNACVESSDPNRLVELLARTPYHVQALLSLSELYGYTNEAAKSAELLERALYACEVAWHPLLPGALAGGCARCQGSLPENEPFFDALFRHVNVLGRKGCVRTALECCKLLLCLDPSDPLGVLQCVDYYALRCGEAPWLLRFGASFADGALPTLPSYAYSLALAAWTQRQSGAEGAGGAGHASPEERLSNAMLLHPAALVRLVEHLSAANALSMDGEWLRAMEAAPFKGADAGGSASLEHLNTLFVERHHSLWRPAAAQAWLKAGALQAVAAACAGAGADWALLRAQAFPAGGRNAYAHLAVQNFSDAVTRNLPPEDNPFLRRPQPQADAMMEQEALADIVAGLPAAQRQQLHAAVEEAAGGGAAGQRNAVLLFLETLFRPDAARGAQQPRPRAQPPPGAEGLLHEAGDSDEEEDAEWGQEAEAQAGRPEFQEVPPEWQHEWAAMRGGDAAQGGEQQQQNWDAPD